MLSIYIPDLCHLSLNFYQLRYFIWNILISDSLNRSIQALNYLYVLIL